MIAAAIGRHFWNDSIRMKHIEMIYYGHLQQCKYFLMVNKQKSYLDSQKRIRIETNDEPFD